MTDTPVMPQTFPPPSLMDRIKGIIGDLARPFAMYSLSTGATAAIIIVARKVENGNDGAIFLGAVTILVGGIYGFKAWENNIAVKHTADVEIAKAAGPSTPPQEQNP